MRFIEGDVEMGPQVVIHWKDGRRQLLAADFLRAKCPCETCKLAPIKLERGMFPGLSAERFDPVGRYALQIEFSDGHKHGAYSFDLLQSFPDEA